MENDNERLGPRMVMLQQCRKKEERQKKTLRLTVLDRDRIGSDFLGETRVALKKLTPGQMKKFNLYLEHAMILPVRKVFNANAYQNPPNIFNTKSCIL